MEKRKSRKDSSVFIRFAPEEKEMIREIAESQGHTVSSYLRHMILTTLKEKGASSSDKKETKETIYGF